MKNAYQEPGYKHGISFFYRLMLSIVAIIFLISLVIGGFSYGLATQTINEMELKLTQKNTEIIESTINETLSFVDTVMTEVIETKTLRDTVEEKTIPETELESIEQRIDYAVKKILYDAKKNESASITILNIYLKNGFSYSSLPGQELNYTDFKSCYEYISSTEMIESSNYIPTTWTETITIKNSSGTVVQNCLCVRFIYDSITMEKIGIVVVGIEEAGISSLYSAYFPEAYIFQNNGTIISSNDNLLIGTKVTPELVSQMKSAKTPSGQTSYEIDDEENLAIYWRNLFYSIYFVIPIENKGILPNDVILNFAKRSMLIAGIAMLIGIVVAYGLTRSLSKSILLLKEVVQKVYEGDFDTRYVPIHNDEIAYLGRHVNNMLDQIEESYIARERDALEKSVLELKLLQSQMNPHLLYNTLNSVALAIKSNNSEKAERLLFKLSSFFRLSLSKGNEKITINTEMEMIRNYIDIQNLARQKEIKLIEKLQKDILTYNILRMTILPAVENSVIHGFSGYRDKDGRIIVRGITDKDKNTLTITVRDNGIGIEKKALDELNKFISIKNRAKEQKHFGLYNVNWRIKNQWGVQYGVVIRSEISDYTEVEITLPL